MFSDLILPDFKAYGFIERKDFWDTSADKHWKEQERNNDPIENGQPSLVVSTYILDDLISRSRIILITNPLLCLHNAQLTI